MFGDGVFDGGILVSGGDGVLGVWGGLGKVWIMGGGEGGFWMFGIKFVKKFWVCVKGNEGWLNVEFLDGILGFM